MTNKIKLIKSILIFTLLIFSGSNAFALSAGKKTDKVSAAVITNKNEVRHGENISVLVRIDMLDGWHTYWKNPGQAGEETKIEWDLDGEYSAAEIDRSSPIIFKTDEIVQYGYDKTAYYLYEFSPEEKSFNIFDRYGVEAVISYLACREECVPEKIKLRLSLPVTEKDMFSTEEWNREIEKAKTSFPIKNDWKSFYRKTDDNSVQIELTANLPKLSNARYIPYEENLINDSADQALEIKKDGITLEISLEHHDTENLEGILLIGGKAYEIDPTFINETVHIENKPSGRSHFIWILAAAFLGGLILNLMPCIFPILTLKAISLAQSAHNPKESRIEALMYFLGVIISFLIIASLLALFRMNGEKIGWGFQLQSPVFVISMIVVFFIIFLMLLDLITVKVPFAHAGRVSFHRKRINSFFTGLFSVLIASPCTAPFMGIAIGYTLSRPLYIYYPVFLSLSIGYALPFALIGFFPSAVLKILPGPGKWMIILKKIFSIPILLTCLWLAWVLYNQIIPADGDKWEKYSEKRVEEALKTGNPVFIDFTAKWCIICLVNKKTALDSKEFAKIIKEKNIRTFRADWTNYNEEIEKALEKYGRNSIPLYVYYPAGGGDYKLLPQIITPDILKKYLTP